MKRARAHLATGTGQAPVLSVLASLAVSVTPALLVLVRALMVVAGPVCRLLLPPAGFSTTTADTSTTSAIERILHLLLPAHWMPANAADAPQPCLLEAVSVAIGVPALLLRVLIKYALGPAYQHMYEPTTAMWDGDQLDALQLIASTFFRINLVVLKDGQWLVAPTVPYTACWLDAYRHLLPAALQRFLCTRWACLALSNEHYPAGTVKIGPSGRPFVVKADGTAAYVSWIGIVGRPGSATRATAAQLRGAGRTGGAGAGAGGNSEDGATGAGAGTDDNGVDMEDLLYGEDADSMLAGGSNGGAAAAADGHGSSSSSTSGGAAQQKHGYSDGVCYSCGTQYPAAEMQRLKLEHGVSACPHPGCNRKEDNGATIKPGTVVDVKLSRRYKHDHGAHTDNWAYNLRMRIKGCYPKGKSTVEDLPATAEALSKELEKRPEDDGADGARRIAWLIDSTGKVARALAKDHGADDETAGQYAAWEQDNLTAQMTGMVNGQAFPVLKGGKEEGGPVLLAALFTSCGAQGKRNTPEHCGSHSHGVIRALVCWLRGMAHRVGLYETTVQPGCVTPNPERPWECESVRASGAAFLRMRTAINALLLRPAGFAFTGRVVTWMGRDNGQAFPFELPAADAAAAAGAAGGSASSASAGGSRAALQALPQGKGGAGAALSSSAGASASQAKKPALVSSSHQPLAGAAAHQGAAGVAGAGACQGKALSAEQIQQIKALAATYAKVGYGRGSTTG